MLEKVALIMPYYGGLPAYFNFYLRSLVGMNFDVLFFSDLKVERHPENFRLIGMSFDEFKYLANKKLGVPVRLDTPIRLCDFRPMYGKIFEDYLKGYDYWAFGDCDLVYGLYFNDEIADALDERVDVFSTQRHFTAGPFCMIRNDCRCKMLFSLADNWEAVAARSGSNLAFDELCGNFHDQLRRGEMTIEDCRRHADSFSAVVRRTTGLKLKFKDVLYQNSLADGSTVEMTADGGLTASGNPIAAYHFVRAKVRRYFTYVYQDYDDIGSYVIDDAGFYVTPNQIMFRKIFNVKRKLLAARKSLSVNGMGRFLGKHK